MANQLGKIEEKLVLGLGALALLLLGARALQLLAGAVLAGKKPAKAADNSQEG